MTLITKVDRILCRIGRRTKNLVDKKPKRQNSEEQNIPKAKVGWRSMYRRHELISPRNDQNNPLSIEFIMYHFYKQTVCPNYKRIPLKSNKIVKHVIDAQKQMQAEKKELERDTYLNCRESASIYACCI